MAATSSMFRLRYGWEKNMQTINITPTWPAQNEGNIHRQYTLQVLDNLVKPWHCVFLGMASGSMSSVSDASSQFSNIFQGFPEAPQCPLHTFKSERFLKCPELFLTKSELFLKKSDRFPNHKKNRHSFRAIYQTHTAIRTFHSLNSSRGDLGIYNLETCPSFSNPSGWHSGQHLFKSYRESKLDE